MGCGTLFVTVNKDKNGLCEVFANLGKAGGCPSQSEAMCRAVSAALRCGVDPKVLIEQLKGIRCLSTIASRKTNKDTGMQKSRLFKVTFQCFSLINAKIVEFAFYSLAILPCWM